MMKQWIALATGATIMMASAGSATQDLAPVIDPGAVAHGTLVGNIPRNQMGNPPLRRPQATNARSRAAATCANKHSARERLGADHPQVQQLYRLCSQAGL